MSDDQEEQIRHDIKELKTVKKQWHVASIGTVLPDGNTIGECPRKAILRYLGIKTSAISTAKSVMFEGGRLNELVWEQKLKRVHSGIVWAGDEKPNDPRIVSDGNLIGHVDVLLCDSSGKIETGIELKTVCSLWTAVSVFVEKQPKLEHLIQSGLYMKLLGLSEYKLAYTQYVNYYSPEYDFIAQKVNGQFGEFIESKTHKKKEIPKNFLSRRKIYDVKLDFRGYVDFKEEHGEETKYSPIDVSTCQKYIELCETAINDNSLPAPSLALDCLGNKCNYKKCQYCDLSEICGSDKLKDNPTLSNLIRLSSDKFGVIERD